MTWAVVSIILLSLIKILMTCLPTGPVEWLIKKWEIHSKLNKDIADVTIDEKRLVDEDKNRFINYFNEAIFLEKHYIFPGTEELFLHPKDSETPIVIDTKRGK